MCGAKCRCKNEDGPGVECEHDCDKGHESDAPAERVEPPWQDQFVAQAWCQGVRPALPRPESADDAVASLLAAVRSTPAAEAPLAEVARDITVEARVAIATEHRDELLAIAAKQRKGGATRSMTATYAQADAITMLLDAHKALVSHLTQCPQVHAQIAVSLPAPPDAGEGGR
jgi:hypothetical protein